MPKRTAKTDAVDARAADTPPEQSEKTEVVPQKKSARRSSRLAKKHNAKVDMKAPPKPGAVLYIGHIPHGFYEEEMRGFFSQFGEVTRVRLSRSKKTAKSKHYAFVEFQYPQVAEIAAEAMNNYLMHGKILKVHLVPDSGLHDEMFHGANRKFTKVPKGKVEREKRDKERTPAQQKARLSKLVKRDEARSKKIAEMGIEYEFKGYKTTAPEKASHKKF
mmetsp:Transcript_38641/g.84034  ORF Transcript_38641/g.84034 Transcript_38641/m.84034 type:complete len:218 (-) Transcript_38641:124-777(-)|eukprot:CAMPEP_0118937740 /NCGR_PEP_ID=MMETSP1169-20130426/23646_1 /TAXON_ID=36882 /ORGANISM="Pyramimonas obovata, Strain CCMP722" /LENGTH=217 /DNA_ID=CAMNT_0006881467 /DNA_START=26 /DNA_END=679 /DNA_ORIENTATION=+